MGRMDEKLNKKRQAIEDKEAELDGASKKVSRVVLGILSIFKRSQVKAKKESQKQKMKLLKKKQLKCQKRLSFYIYPTFTSPSFPKNI